MRKKNIDQLFQEKFQDFSEFPDEKIWERLEVSLDEQKKDRKLIIPLWWKLGGVAAVLAVVFFAVNRFENNEAIPALTDTEKISPKSNSVIKNKTLTDDKALDKIEVTGVKPQLNSNDDESTLPAIKNSKTVINKNKQTSGTVVAAASQKQATHPSTKNTVTNGNKRPTEETTIAALANNASDAANETSNEAKALQVDADAALSATETALAQTKEEVLVGEESIQKKSIYDEITDTEEAVVAANKKDRWSVGASVAPVYFNSLNNGSPIDENFVSNSKTGNVNMSYGVSVAYNVGKKLSIRSGLHKVDYGYNTNDVVFKSVFNPETNSVINSIDYASNSENVVVETKKSSLSSADNSEFSAKSASREGRMVQQFGYIELPLELNYALTDGKFGVNLIGGLSSLFLLDNSISLEADNLKTALGESNNINNLNFSTNVGVGLNYKFTPKVRLNIEPMFKYQLNTFSNSSGDFQPFTMGVYSGLSFKF